MEIGTFLVVLILGVLMLLIGFRLRWYYNQDPEGFSDSRKNFMGLTMVFIVGGVFAIVLALVFYFNPPKTMVNEKDLKPNTAFKESQVWLDQFTQNDKKIKELIKTSPRVRVLSYCNISADCGTMAFASVSKVLVLEGRYTNDTIAVGKLCVDVNYSTEEIYRLNVQASPDFGVMLCNGKTFNDEYNYGDRTEHYLVFGHLDRYNPLEINFRLGQ